MRIYLDTEFYEDGKSIELISIGMVREDGETYYAEVQGAGLICEKNEWLMENVHPHLTGPRKARSQIAMEIVEFVDIYPEFWAWYGSYDWVVLCQLYGRMVDLPPTWPMFIQDFRQISATTSEWCPRDSSIDGPVHHALSDAKWLDRAMSAWEIDQKRFLEDRASAAAVSAHEITEFFRKG